MRYDPASDHYVPVQLGRGLRSDRRELKALDPQIGDLLHLRPRQPGDLLLLRAVRAALRQQQPARQLEHVPRDDLGRAQEADRRRRRHRACSRTSSNCDAIFFFGQNTGSNSPRLLHPLQEAVKRGVQIVTFNPVREKGLEVFINPQNPSEMLTGKATRISCQYHQVKAGGDIAAIMGMCKHVLAEDDEAKAAGRHACSTSTSSSSTRTASKPSRPRSVRNADWSEIERASGLSRDDLEGGGARSMSRPNDVIGIYGMGLTQHVHGFENVAMLVNLLLLRGNIGRDGAGISPGARPFQRAGPAHRRHLREARAGAARQAREACSASSRRAKKGMNTVEACEGILAGKVKAFVGLGGNFVRAIPERAKMEAGLARDAPDRPDRHQAQPQPPGARRGRLSAALPRPHRRRHPGERAAGRHHGGHLQLHPRLARRCASRRASICVRAGDRRRPRQGDAAAQPEAQWDEWVGDYGWSAT